MELQNLLNEQQKSELDHYIEKIKAEYLQKIVDKVKKKNVVYYENLACEYSLQLMDTTIQSNDEAGSQPAKIE